MHLCALGKVENDLLTRVITHSVQNFPSQMVKHEFLFAYMLQVNIPSLSWGEIIYALNWSVMSIFRLVFPALSDHFCEKPPLSMLQKLICYRKRSNKPARSAKKTAEKSMAAIRLICMTGSAPLSAIS